jgi:hypothetical protein
MAREIKIGKKKIKVRNPLASALSLGQFKPKVFKDKRKYNRKKNKKVILES